ncbi:MAG TPA: hypothetical protein VK348_05865, partial [Planctomycetota bacterium]|nr:hypothetical protein [Planctomycetota bacterium]
PIDHPSLRLPTASEQILDRLEVEVLEHGARLPAREGVVVALEQDPAVTEHAICESWRRFVEQCQVDRPSRGRFEPADQISEVEHRQRLRQAADGEIEIALGMLRSAGARTEHQRVADARVCGQHSAHRLEHARTLRRTARQRESCGSGGTDVS